MSLEQLCDVAVAVRRRPGWATLAPMVTLTRSAIPHAIVALSSLFALTAACSSSEPSSYPYAPNETRVIGSADEDDGESSMDAPQVAGVTPVLTSSTSSSDLCLGAGKDCETPKQKCGDGATADVIVGVDGEVLSIVCYPNKNYEVVSLGDTVEEPKLGNNVVAVLDDDDDGVDVEGDLLIEGNNVIVYGAGPEASVIGGNLEVIKNNAIVRGVRIAGDAILRKNNTALVYCVIEGDLLVIGNNNSLALCEVWGDVIIDGNNTVLVSNLIAGVQDVRGTNLRCHDNHRFTDIDGDGVVQDDDVLGPVNCLPAE